MSESFNSAPPHRLTRSSREKMWAGVAGGLAEYFEVDPTLVRLVFVAAAIVTGGLAIPVYLALWFLMPRDDPSEGGTPYSTWQEWSRDVADRTREFAGKPPVQGSAWGSAAGAGPAGPAESGAATPPEGRVVAGEDVPPPPPPPAGGSEWSGWRHGPHQRRRQRSGGLVLIAIGVLFLAANLGWLRWINGDVFWPALLVILGIGLLIRQGDWNF